MFYFKDVNGNTYSIGSLDLIDTLPDGCVEIDAEELEALRALRAPSPPTPEELAAQAEEVKRALLAEAMIKRDVLLVHLERLRTRAIEANNTTARDALSAAIASFENVFNDPRVVSAIDGEVKPVLSIVNKEIGLALAQSSPASYQALLALDPL